MYRYFAFILINLCSLTSNGQTNKVTDSLLKAVDTEKDDSTRMEILSRIGKLYMYNNAGKAIDYLVQSQEIAKKLDDQLMIAINQYNLGTAYLIKSDYKKSLDNYLQAVRIYEHLKDSFRLANTYMAVGSLYNETKDLLKTNEYYDKAKQLIEAQKDSLQLTRLFMQRGSLYDQQLQYDKAIEYLQKALALAKIQKDDFLITNALGNIGLTYKHMHNTSLALKCFDSVLTAYKTMEAPVENYAMIYNNIAATHTQAGNFQAAKQAFNKSIGYSITAGSPLIEMENYNNMAEMFGLMKDHEQQAVYLKKYYNIKDSLFTVDNKNQLTQLDADYQVEKRNAEILKKDVEVARQKSQRNIFVIIAIAIAVVFSILAFFYRRISRNNRDLLLKNELISRQKNELEILNQVKDRLFGIISHDLRNPLVTLRSYLSLADDISIPAEKKEMFKQTTMQALIQTCDMLDNLLVWANLQIKRTNTTISPVNIEECLADLMETVNIQAAKKNISIKTAVDANIALGDYTVLSIALRNLLTNAIKFSNTGKTILISTAKEKSQVLIAVKDEGRGITAEQLLQINNSQAQSTLGTQNEKGSGLGIFLVKELVQKINGSLTIDSEEGKGSCFTIRLEAA